MAEKTWTILKSETTAFVIGLLCVIFGVYLLLAFSSFFFTGGNDQSILSHPNPSELRGNGQPHTELCRSTGSAAGAVPD